MANDKPLPIITASDALWARAQGLIPAGTQTLAKGPGQLVRGVAPKYVTRGKGGHVWDVDGNQFIDYSMAIGPLSLGYCDPDVDEAIRAQLADGITFSLMHPLEVEVAEMVRDVIPNAESVRYTKSGCDVTSAAVRAARAFTGRDKILCCGYHGWHDWYIAVTDRNKGIPKAVQELTFTFDFNDLASVEEALDDEVACVILEPTVFEAPRDDFLKKLHALCQKNGSLLVFDEMWTGFRLAMGGAQEKWGVTPDLACYSKAIANGMPLGVLTGRRDVMSVFEKDVFFFTTFGGEALSLAAAKACMTKLAAHDVPRALGVRGKQLRDGVDALLAELGIGYVKCIGQDQRTMLTFDAKAGSPLELKSLWQQEMIREGVLSTGIHNMCFAHTEDDVARTLDAYRHALAVLDRAVARKTVREELRGEPVEPVFRKTTQFNMKPKARAAT